MKALARCLGERERIRQESGDEFLLMGFLFTRASFLDSCRTGLYRELVAARSCRNLNIVQALLELEPPCGPVFPTVL